MSRLNELYEAWKTNRDQDKADGLCDACPEHVNCFRVDSPETFLSLQVFRAKMDRDPVALADVKEIVADVGMEATKALMDEANRQINAKIAAGEPSPIEMAEAEQATVRA